RLSATASAVTSFDCSTEPLPPGLRTRIGAFSLDAPNWNAAAPASASCRLHAPWPATCRYEPPWPPPVCDWSIDASVLLAFSAAATAVVLFDCETSPSLPGLSTRIDSLLFDGFSWTA